MKVKHIGEVECPILCPEVREQILDSNAKWNLLTPRNTHQAPPKALPGSSCSSAGESEVSLPIRQRTPVFTNGSFKPFQFPVLLQHLCDLRRIF